MALRTYTWGFCLPPNFPCAGSSHTRLAALQCCTTGPEQGAWWSRTESFEGISSNKPPLISSSQEFSHSDLTLTNTMTSLNDHCNIPVSTWVTFKTHKYAVWCFWKAAEFLFQVFGHSHLSYYYPLHQPFLSHSALRLFLFSSFSPQIQIIIPSYSCKRGLPWCMANLSCFVWLKEAASISAPSNNLSSLT